MTVWKSLKFSFPYKAKTDPLRKKIFVHLSSPRAHNRNSTHICEPISFDFSSENLFICQEFFSTLIRIIFVPTAVRNNISKFTLSVKKEKSPNSNFLLLVISEILLARFLLFKLLNILVAACSIF